ncbi:MAG: helix-turn-helix domain-containing protein [Nitrospirales bacterium]
MGPRLATMSLEKPNPTSARFFSVKELAADFGVNDFALYKKIRLGVIPHYRFGKKILLDRHEVQAVLRVPAKTKGRR